MLEFMVWQMVWQIERRMRLGDRAGQVYSSLFRDSILRLFFILRLFAATGS